MTELTTTPPEKKSTSLNEILAKPLIASINLDWEKTIYLLFIIMAIVTRFAALGTRVMSHDESLHTQFSYQYFIGEGYNHTPLMHGPFLFHITALSYWLFGDSDLAARVPAAIFGVILIAIPYFLRKPLGKVGALFTSFIFLISPYITYYSRYIRHDIYIIVWAMIVFIAIWYYLDTPKEKYIGWFAAGTALMFATKEIAFIYVAIFGSFLVIRLLAKMWMAPWLKNRMSRLYVPILIVFVAALLIGGGVVGQKLIERSAPPADDIAIVEEGSAIEPTPTPTPTTGINLIIVRGIQVMGIGILSLGLFLGARALRPEIDQFGEFDLIMLFTTLILPMTTPLIVRILGMNPIDYLMPQCTIPGQENMAGIQLALARMFNAECWSMRLDADIFSSILILAVIFIVSILVGLWWNARKWPIAAAIFYAIFLVLYTSVFTNITGGMASGMLGSLGYWLEQQEVQRGSQPTFYYLIVMPIYEFLPVIFSLAAMWLWSKKQRLLHIFAYWVTLLLAAYGAFTLTKWFYNRTYRLKELLTEMEATVLTLPRDVFLGLIVALAILLLGSVLWLVTVRKAIKRQYDEESLTHLFRAEQLLGFLPYVAWWLLLTWVAYTVAGEKMPWLSTHFVIPMALMSGWYFGKKLKNFTRSDLFSQPSLILGGLSALAVVTLFGIFSFFWLDKVQLGNQQVDALQNMGLLLGFLVVTGIVIYFWWQRYQKTKRPLRSTLIVLVIFTLLSLLTIRATYMASFPNADYTTEYMVYAHGAPATKNIVMDQIETLSMRLYGDKSIQVAYDNDVSWPFTWYLREYPNRYYFGEEPNNNLNESPIILAGNVNWEKVEPYLGNNYEHNTYTFLWWPMEEYRQIGWNSVFGNAAIPNDRGLADAGKRQALWDIFFYRDYEQYGQAFGGTYTAEKWPLRHELKVYIRKDVLASLWDQGIILANIGTYTNPYARGELVLQPTLILNELGLPGSADGQFNTPRNIAISPDGTIFVADSGNHRIQVFDSEGNFVTSWGEFGELPGQLNEPWGIAADDEHVYVADTWNYRIQKFTHDGEHVSAFGSHGATLDPNEPNLGLFYGPRDITLIENNRLAITDTGNHRIQVMDKDGSFQNIVGSLGSDLGFFNEPVGLATGPNGHIYLVDTWNGRIQELSPDLLPVSAWPVDSWYSQSIDNKPYVAVDSQNRIYVTDPEGFRVLIFDADGSYLGRFGTYGTAANQFALPIGIAIDAQDNVYVVDAHNNRVVKYAPIFGAPVKSTLDDDDTLFEGFQGEDDTLSGSEEDAVEEEMPAGPTP